MTTDQPVSGDTAAVRWRDAHTLASGGTDPAFPDRRAQARKMTFGFYVPVFVLGAAAVVVAAVVTVADSIGANSPIPLPPSLVDG